MSNQIDGQTILPPLKCKAEKKITRGIDLKNQAASAEPKEEVNAAAEQSMSGFGGGWSGPSSAKASPAPASSAPSQKKPAASAPAPPAKVGATNAGSNTTDQQPQKYHALVVDSGAIIKHSAFSTLHNAAETYYTVPAVLDEIRDAKAREHLDNLPFELQTRVPTAEAMKAMSDFSRLTGDYRSLSSVDMQVLALLYDLGKFKLCYVLLKEDARTNGSF